MIKNIYDYARNINIVTTPNGDKVITMNKEILSEIIVYLYEAKEHQEEDGRNATAQTTQEIINILHKGE